MKKTITLKTRPFQPLLLAAEDLLRIAKPYFDQIQEHKAIYDSSGKFTMLPDGVWQTEKSLSIAAFMTKYAGLEALVNSCLNDFAQRPAVELSDEYFVGPLAPHRNKLKKGKPENWRLATRLFLSIPICSDPAVDPTSMFDIESHAWKEFEEVIDIRHAFAHANSVDIKQVLTKVGPKEWIADDTHPDNFWPITKTPKDHRIFNYEVANNLCRVIEWVNSVYREALKNHLDDTYGSQEIAVIEAGGKLSLAQPNLTKTISEKVARSARPKQGRNEPCACGSGKKYKKCCGK